MRFYEKSLVSVNFWRGLGKTLNNALPHSVLRSVFGGMSFVEIRGHVVKTCSLPICLSLCDYLLEQLILLSMNLFCKPNFSNC